MNTFRKAVKSDISELRDLFIDTVMTVNRPDYTLAEIEDWASCGEGTERWNELFDQLQFFVAERNGKIVGFSSISEQGYLHSIFVHKEYQRQGIATELLQLTERHAKENSAETITSDVSITAKPFFIKHGYFVVAKKTSLAKHLNLINYKMHKTTNITISHIAIWTCHMECSRSFYQKYFGGKSTQKYTNPTKGFSSYFVTFGNGAAIEIMQRNDITIPNTGSECVGLAHFAFTVGSADNVNQHTEWLRSDGYTINSEPRTTGDGFYEASVLDPDGNIIEIIA